MKFKTKTINLNNHQNIYSRNYIKVKIKLMMFYKKRLIQKKDILNWKPRVNNLIISLIKIKNLSKMQPIINQMDYNKKLMLKQMTI